jgi:hypothetical protein
MEVGTTQGLIKFLIREIKIPLKFKAYNRDSISHNDTFKVIKNTVLKLII